MARTKQRYRTEKAEVRSTQTYRTGIYVRLSKERTENWRNKSQSLETQESLARTFAKEHGLTVVNCYVDYEYSGTQFNRPAFQEMMEDIKKGTINCILIRDLSRLGRDYIEMGRLIDKVFPFLGVRFISINDHLDTLNGLDDKKSFEVEIKNLVNDLYSKDISKKVTARHIQQASQGYFIGSVAPYGYQLDKQEGGVKLIIDPVVQPILKAVFQMLLDGSSIIKVTRYLNDTGISVPTEYRKTGSLYRSSSDSTHWRDSTLHRLVQSPIYQGYLVQRRTNKSLSEKDYIRFENAHEAYIDSDEYEEMITLFSNRRQPRKSTIPKTPNRYQGLLYAKGKSTQMPRMCRHFSNQKSDYDYYYFMDYVYDSEKLDRQTVYISEKVLDQIVLKLVQEEMTRLGTLETLLPSLEVKKDKCILNYQKQIGQYQHKTVALQHELNELYASYSLSRENKSAYICQKNEKVSKIETLAQEIAECETSIREIELEYSKQVTWLQTLAKCQNLSLLTSELLDALIDRIEVDVDKTVTIFFTCQIGGNHYA